MNAIGTIAAPVDSNLTALRLALRSGGYLPVPVSSPTMRVSSAGKRPVMKDWCQACADADDTMVRSWQTTQPDCTNTGLLTGTLIAVDGDILAPELADQVAQLAEEMLGWTPLVRIGRAPKWLRCYRAETPLRKMETPELVLPGDAKAQVEVLGAGQQFVSHGIHPDTRQAYSWPESTPQGVPLEELPIVSEELLRRFVAATEAVLRAAGGRTEKEIAREAAGAPGAAVPIRVAAAPAGAAREAQGGTRDGEFFQKVNTAALANIAAWLPAIFPRAEHQTGTGAWRISSEELGRQLEEDISVHPEGAQDFGTRQGCSPVDIALEHGGAPDAKAAAFWLCEKLGKQPAELGWWEKRQRKLAQAAEDAPDPTDDPRPVIQVAAGRLDRLATQAEAVVKASGLPVFQRGTTLVQPVITEVPASRGRMTVAAGLTELSQPAMIDLFSAVAQWVRFDKRSEAWLPTDPPMMVAAVLLSRIGKWKLPRLAGVVTTPTLRPDGTVLTAAGYDATTRLYHVPDPALRLPAMPGKPTPADAAAALASLRALLVGFPFKSDVDRAVALSLLITPVVRGALSVAPLHAIKAHTAGTGKSYLVDLSSAIATGRPCPVVAAAASAEETEKRLVGLLLAAFPIVSLDNVNGELGGDILCQAVERPLIRVRPLGRSDIIEIESRACIFATGNALRVRGDMVRRSLVSELDAEMERPELRQFAQDPVAEVLADRGRYVGACLTIVRAYLAAGRPRLLPALASFEDWSALVRSALVWLGEADPCTSMEAAREDDPELTEMREVLTLWQQHVGTDGRTARDIADEASRRAPTQMGEPADFAAPELRDALLRIAGDRGAISTRRLGKWLMDHEGRIVGGLRIKRAGVAHGGGARWAVRAA
ncbi:MAG: bifunctional DNA primase/polymerase [Janthinobacterium lividum]